MQFNQECWFDRQEIVILPRTVVFNPQHGSRTPKGVIYSTGMVLSNNKGIVWSAKVCEWWN